MKLKTQVFILLICNLFSKADATDLVVLPEYPMTSSIALQGGAAFVPKNETWVCRYIDRHGKFLPGSYNYAEPFSEDLAAVAERSKWGFINADGRLIITCKFDEALPFSNGMAAVRIGEKWGFIDKTGAVKIKPQFAEVDSFSEGLAICARSDQQAVCIDKAGNSVFALVRNYSNIQPFSNGLSLIGLDPDSVSHRYSFINRKGKIASSGFSITSCSFSEGLASVGKTNKEGLFVQSYINTAGAEVLKTQFTLGGCFHSGLARVATASSHKQTGNHFTGKWGFINREGKLMIPLKFDDVGDFKEGLAPCKLKNKWGVVDRSGAVRIGFKFDELDTYSDGLALARIGSKNFYINQNGEQPFSLNAVFLGRFSNGRALVATPPPNSKSRSYSGFGFCHNLYTACPVVE